MASLTSTVFFSCLYTVRERRGAKRQDLEKSSHSKSRKFFQISEFQRTVWLSVLSFMAPWSWNSRDLSSERLHRPWRLVTSRNFWELSDQVFCHSLRIAYKRSLDRSRKLREVIMCDEGQNTSWKSFEIPKTYRPPWMAQMLVRQISKFPRSCKAP